jgi:hypothetical protein
VRAHTPRHDYPDDKLAPLEFGGPTWNDNGAGESAADRPYGGSFFVFEAENYEAALAIFKEDEYYKHGLVSDLEPFCAALACSWAAVGHPKDHHRRI